VDRPIPGTEGGVSPFFSSDGESVGFFGMDGLKKMSLAGGSPITLSSAGPGGRSGSWSEDTIVFAAARESGQGLYRVSASGGETETLAIRDSDSGEIEYSSPRILPGSEAVLFGIRAADNYHTAVLSLDTGEKRIIVEGGRQATYLATGHLIYEQTGTGNLMGVPFDLTSLKVTGDPVPVFQGVRRATPGQVDYAISENGTVVYVPGVGAAHQHSLVWVDRDGNETSVTNEKRDFSAPRISPDGKRFAINTRDTQGTRNVWIYDLEAGSLNRLTFDESTNGSAAWSPDSKWLAFQSGSPGNFGIAKQPVDRSSPQERLTSTPNRQNPSSWSPDGKLLAFSENPRPGVDIGILPIEGDGEPEYILSSSANECCPKFSPDGKWLTYVSDELGRPNVYVRPFPEPDVKWLISAEDLGGGQPVWSPDGTELFYRSGIKTMVVSIQTQDQTLNLGSPRVLFEGRYVSHSSTPGYQYYDISPDGKRFLMMKEEVALEQARINVVLNWFEELKRLVPTP